MIATRMELFLFIILAILVIGGLASYWASRLTKGWPVVLRLIPVALHDKRCPAICTGTDWYAWRSLKFCSDDNP